MATSSAFTERTALPGQPADTGTPARPRTALRARTASRQPLAHRASLALVLLGTAALYIIGLGASGYANSFYSAAAQAGSTSWEALFFGSLDAGNSITVDKPPAAMWIMGLSVRIFGLSSWSILVPEALLGVASVATLYFAVRRSLGYDQASRSFRPTSRAHWAALAGAVVFALTPAATLLFRFNNPDALLVFLMTLASYFTIRASEKASRRWLVFAGVAIGFGFLTKMLQAFLVLPALVVAYAVAAPATWKKKIVDLLAACAAMIASMAWYIAIVELLPASMRPYIGGSQNNSFLELVFGYNGLGRITGNETGSVGGGNGGGWGSTGITRLFDGVSGGMIAWLIPAALILTAFAYAVFGRRAWATTLRKREPNEATQANAGLIVFTGWLVATGLVFSYMAGIYHDYYTIALAPAIGGSVAVGAAVLWQHRARLVARIGLAAAITASVVWAVSLLARAGGWYLTMGGIAAATGTIAALAILFADRLPKLLAGTALALAFASVMAGPTAYSVQTASTAHTGSIVTAGPVSGMGMGGGPTGQGGPMGQTPTGTQPPTGTSTGAGPGAQGGGMGGLLNGASVSTELADLLSADAGNYTWVAATVGSQNSASYQLATGDPVMAIGGFNGSDPSPTLAQFKALVAEGKIHYFIGSGMGGQQNGGSSAASEIVAWVQANFTAKTVGGTTVYDLTASS